LSQFWVESAVIVELNHATIDLFLREFLHAAIVTIFMAKTMSFGFRMLFHNMQTASFPSCHFGDSHTAFFLRSSRERHDDRFRKRTTASSLHQEPFQSFLKTGQIPSSRFALQGQ
jgi:hypothetical protein